MAVADSHADEHHDHDHHDHGEFIAHHFDNAEQQFDSGKLGIWVFLVTEVLFFSGLFVAYILYRNHHPEIFEQAHVFLDKWLGGVNTVVLLFSSLTMALAVRAAQLGKNKQVALMVLITMVCAAVFLGVKAVEYSHKWDMGILVRSAFDAPTLAAALNDGVHPEPTVILGLKFSKWLVTLSIVPAVLLVAFLIASGVAKGMNKDIMSKFMACMAITVGGYFIGLLGGYFYQEMTADSHGSHAMVTPADQDGPMVLYALTQDEDHDEKAHAEEEGHEHEHGEDDDHDHAEGAHAEGEHDHGHEHGSSHGPKVDPADYNRDIGIFFSIYYCMTGLHAIHIIGGIAALAWILYRSLAGHWREDYFGPVDYVGLYWHLVDLIWIYLFPMLYLID